MEPEDLIISDTDYIRLAKLENSALLAYELSRAYVVPAEQVPTNVVSMNARVTYLDESNGVRREVELVFPEEADVEYGKISVLSPVGLALLGLREGQSIEWSFPNSRSRNLRVLSVATPTRKEA